MLFAVAAIEKKFRQDNQRSGELGHQIFEQNSTFEALCQETRGHVLDLGNLVGTNRHHLGAIASL